MHSSVLNQTYPTSQSVNFSERRPRANQMRILYNKPALNIPPTMLQPKPLAKHQIRSNFFLKGHHFDLSIPLHTFLLSPRLRSCLRCSGHDGTLRDGLADEFAERGRLRRSDHGAKILPRHPLRPLSFSDQGIFSRGNSLGHMV